VSTSSQKYQDNVFEENAMPPNLLSKLGVLNKEIKGAVEAYVYHAFGERLSSIHEVKDYIQQATVDNFELRKLNAMFREMPGLRRSVDKMYEIVVYALFSTLVRALKAQVTLELGNLDKEILRDFNNFVRLVLGVDAKHPKIVMPAALYRVGVANAADRGIDMWSNFGPAVQVKHLTLTPEIVEDIAADIKADKLIIVCVDAERRRIEALLSQLGWRERVQGIITLEDLDKWYQICLSSKYKKSLGKTILKDLLIEFDAEFPSSCELEPFLKERKYDKIKIPAILRKS
jgi:type II restriction enzyme